MLNGFGLPANKESLGNQCGRIIKFSARHGDDLNSRKDLVRRFYDEAYRLGDYRVIDEMFAASFSGNGRPPGSSPIPGPDLVRESVDRLRTAFPDFTPSVAEIVSESDTVVAHLEVTATHLGPCVFASGPSPFVVEATGSRIEFHGLRIYQFENDKVVGGYAWMEELDLLTQMDAVEAYSRWLSERPASG